MVPTSRRVLPAVLLLALVLAACGRSSPSVTADDERGLDRSDGGIWIPEARDVDPGEDMRRTDDDEDDEDDEDDRGTSRTHEDEDTSSDGGRAARGGSGGGERDARQRTGSEEASDRPETRTTSSPAREGTQTESSGGDGSSRSSTDEDGDGGTAGNQDREDERDETTEKDEEPSEPEVVGDCGSSSGASPDDEQLEAAVEDLRAQIADRWPDTQAGAWIVEEPRRVHVGFTESVGARLGELCRSFPHPQLLHGARTALSDAELGELLADVEDDRDRLREGRPPGDLPEEIRATRGRYAAVVEHAGNRLVVTVERPGEGLLEAFRGHYTPQLGLVKGEFDDDGQPVDDE